MQSNITDSNPKFIYVDDFIKATSPQPPLKTTKMPIMMIIIVIRPTRHAGHCWRSKDELISDVLLWTPAYGQAKAGRPARTYIQQL